MQYSYNHHKISEAISVPPKKSPKNTQKTSKSQKNTPKASPKATPTRLTAKAFKRLQKQWYKKLKKSGFKDIEGGQERGYLNGNSSTDVRLQERIVQNSASTQHYYSRWSCYLAHHSGGQLLPLERAVIELYSQGNGAPEIYKQVKKYINWFQLYYLIERLKAHIELWNRTDPNGMDFESDVDNVWPLKK